jgi:transcriptional repressor NrdR
MLCPKCGSDDGKVVDTRARPDGKTRRRYLCKHCGNRFSTVEVHVDELKQVMEYVKQDRLIRDTIASLSDMVDRLK